MTPDKIPHYVRHLALTGVSTAGVTYHFRPMIAGELGWALATVNDATGELTIQSDWGDFTYRWHVGSNLGTVGDRNRTLTEFIADREPHWPGHCEYLADKLTARSDRSHFDSYKTVDAMQRDLAQKRLAWGRDMIDYFRDLRAEDPKNNRYDVGHADPPTCLHRQRVWCLGREEHWPLVRDTARRIFDELDELRGEDVVERFVDGFFKIMGHEFIAEEPWHDSLEYTPSTGYMQLLHGILPALVEACFARAYPGRHRCKLTMPREAGAGHWRDWHRGHGCHLDDTPIAAAAEAHHP